MILREEVKYHKFSTQVHVRYITVAINSENNFCLVRAHTKRGMIIPPLWHTSYSKFFIMSLLPENESFNPLKDSKGMRKSYSPFSVVLQSFTKDAALRTCQFLHVALFCFPNAYRLKTLLCL